MNFNTGLKSICGAFAFIIICISGVIVVAQDKAEIKAEVKAEAKVKEKAYSKAREFCSSDNYSGGYDKVSFRELREMTVGGRSLTVDAGRNGGISVKGEDRNDILVRACVQTSAYTDEAAKNLAASIKIETSPVVLAESSSTEASWAVSYQILVPRSADLKLSTHNGGISISSVDGAMEFAALNGGISLHDVAGDVRGRTTNGGVSVILSGGSWRGAGLNVETTNGGVSLLMPENYAARFVASTVNGGFSTNLSSLQSIQAERKERHRQGVNINTDLNGGGAPIRVVTTNGGVSISARERAEAKY